MYRLAQSELTNKTSLFAPPFSLLTAALFSLPYVVVYGGFYFAAILICIAVLWKSSYRIPMIFLICIYTYDILVSLLSTHNLERLILLNSGLMIQIAGGLVALTFVAINGVKSLMYLCSIVVVVAILSIILQLRGIDPQLYLPSKYSQSDLYALGDIMYGNSDIRLRGVYPEASSLGAVLSSIFSLFATLLINKWSYIQSFDKRLMIFICAIILPCLGIVLTKAGIVILATWLLLSLVLFVFQAGLKKIHYVIGTFLILTVIFVSSYVVLPEQLKDYISSEIDSIGEVFTGGSVHNVTGTGAFARSEGYEIALKSMFIRPFGGDSSEVEKVIDILHITVSDELNSCFSMGVYGLKNAFSNLMVTMGFPGLILLYFFIKSLYIISANKCNISHKRYELNCTITSLVISFVFINIVEERYFYYGFIVILIIGSRLYSRTKNPVTI